MAHKETEKTKEIYDPIHGFITITPLMLSIIDTPEMQRLRELKQLGATYLVFPSATHTRFEHSLGVSHLAGELMRSLQKNQPELKITERDIELTRIAGLVHDIGHGPFSHLYDDQVISKDEPKHEERGCALFQAMCSKYELPLTEEEVVKIQRMVNPDGELYTSNESWVNDHKDYWRYQIVNNELCQLDVDKMDYIRRDCYYLGIACGGHNTFSWDRIITKARVTLHPGSCSRTILAWPEKLNFDIFSVFSARYQLHKQAYHHHAVRAFEFIITEILRRAKRRVEAEESKDTSFLKLTDSIVTCRLHDEFADLQEKLVTRDAPKLVGERIKREAVGNRTRRVLDYIIEDCTIGFSHPKAGNPLFLVPYFKKNSQTQAHFIDPSEHTFLASSEKPRFTETIHRMYLTISTKAAGYAKAMEEAVVAWSRSN